MRKLIVAEYVSLDGVIQAPGHAGEDAAGGFAHGGWTGPYMADHRRYNSELYQTVGAFLLGRLTYEIFAAAWPKVTDEHDQIARALNTLPKYVAFATMRPEQATWAGTTILNGAEVTRLKQEPGRPILVAGSARLVQDLQRHDLIDEYRLWLHPVVLGGGKRLFADGAAPVTFRLVDGMTTRGGLALLTYERAAA